MTTPCFTIKVSHYELSKQHKAWLSHRAYTSLLYHSLCLHRIDTSQSFKRQYVCARTPQIILEVCTSVSCTLLNTPSHLLSHFLKLISRLRLSFFSLPQLPIENLLAPLCFTSLGIHAPTLISRVHLTPLIPLTQLIHCVLLA